MKLFKLHSFIIRAAITFVLCLNTSISYSDEDQWQIRAGIAPLSASLPWKGMEEQSILAPYLDAQFGNWSFGAENIVNYELSLKNNFNLSSGINFRNNGYKNQASVFTKSSTDPVFENYNRPQLEYAAQVGMRWRLLSIALNQDISNNSRSTSIKSGVDIPLYRNTLTHKTIGLQIKGMLVAHWYSAEYINYYYGISKQQADASLGRYQYQGSEAINHQLAFNAIMSFNPEWQLKSIISRTKLDQEIYDSPIIDARYEDQISIVLSYRL